MENLSYEKLSLTLPAEASGQSSCLDPVELRMIATHLISVANAIDSQNHRQEQKCTLARVEKDRLALLASAEAESAARQKRRSLFNQALFGEPAWDILLDLFIQTARCRRVSVKSACQASGVPVTTALRWLAKLEAYRMIKRIPAAHDRRVHYLSLTDEAQLALARWLQHRLIF